MQNKYGISGYEFEREIQAFCPLGNDYYTCRVCVAFEPNDTIFDFCKVDKFIIALGGKRLIVEELVTAVYDELQHYNPKNLIVKGKAKSNTHFDVVVTKAMQHGEN